MADEKVREHEYELRSFGKQEGSLGSVYWDGKKIASDDKKFLDYMKSIRIKQKNKELTTEDGIEFLKALPSKYRSYVSARKVVK